MATRLVAAALAILGALELFALVVRALLGPLRVGAPDVLAGAAGVTGVLLLAANRVTDRSAGAVDNAAGGGARLAPPDSPPPGPPGGGPLPRPDGDGAAPGPGA